MESTKSRVGPRFRVLIGFLALVVLVSVALAFQKRDSHKLPPVLDKPGEGYP